MNEPINLNHILDNVEQNNPILYKHLERVAMMCYELVKKFDIPRTECATMHMAGFCHELGKYGGCDKELEKWQPIISSIILKCCGYDRLAKIVAQHNENYDGTGTPYGMKADEIHLFASFVHICDYYDHQRMNGLSHTETMAKIREQSDIMFPKKLITPFLRIFVTSKDLNFDYSGERHEW